MKILVIDDDAETREALALVLTREGFDVDTACDGIAGLETLRTRRLPDVILLDLLMPGMNGLEFRQCLTEHREWAAIPIVYLTGAFHDGAALPLGANVLPKPCEVDRLLDKVRETAMA